MTYVSPSQIATWRGCQRKWAYSRQRPRTQNKYAEFGTAMHTELELWLTGQRPPDNTTLPGRTAMAGLKHLPMPGTCAVEQRVDIEYENVHYLGYIDATWYDADARCVNVVDHKSCGSFQYCHTPEHSDTFDYEAYLRDILGPGHGEKAREKLGEGPTGHELRQAGLKKAGGACKKMM